MNYIKILSVVIACAAISLGGCGGGSGGGSGGGGAPRAITSQIASDPGFDGDIEQAAPATYNIVQGMSPTVQSVFAGIYPATLTEFRAFLDFPLTGAGGIPGNAIIDSAYLDIYINSIQPASGTIPLLIELVSFQPPTLIGTDFDRSIQPPLASMIVSRQFSEADVGTNISLDVTPLMMEAQRLNLNDFQVRISEDAAIPVLLEISDTTGADRSTRAPLLTVSYF